MTAFDRFERTLPDLFEELAQARVPDYYPDLVARTAATRQRAGWTFPERWLPMSTLTQRLAADPRIPWRLGALVALLAVAGLITALVAGALLDPRPAPYGPAANGLIAFVDADGRVILGDPKAETTVMLTPDAGNSDPLFSLDGSRLFYLHHVPGGKVDLMVANVRGSERLKLNATPISNPSYGGWSPRGDLFVIVSGQGELLLYDTTRTAEPRNLSASLDPGRISIGLGYNFRSTHAFRPPAGSEILFSTNERTLEAVAPDGTGHRTILDQKNTSIPFTRVSGGEWSPDGSRIAVLLEIAPHPDRWHAYVLNADGSDLRPLGDLGANPQATQNSLLWSPDGTRLAYQYWIAHRDGEGQDFNPIGIADVATGVTDDVGPVVFNGYVSWEWSPDGTAIIEVPQDGSGDILIVDAVKGTWATAPWSVDQAISWQRVAK